MTKKEVLEYITKSFDLKHQGYYKPAIEMLYKALSLDSENIEILAQLAHLYKLLGNYERSRYYIEKTFEIDNEHLFCLMLLKEILVAENNISEAYEIVERIYTLQPTGENLAEKVKYLKDLKQYDMIKEIETSNDNLNDNVMYEIACSYLNSDSQKAFETLKQGLEINPNNENILFLLGKIYYEQNDFDKAKEIFQRLEKVNPCAEVMNYLGLFELQNKNYIKAVKYFSKALSENSLSGEYAYNLASSYFLQGWFDEAGKLFNQAICLSPENADYHYSLAYLYYQTKEYDKANMEISFIHSIDENHSLTKVLNAMICAKKGNLIEAKSQLEKFIEENPNDDFALCELSKIYAELSQFDLARQTITKASKISPDTLSYQSELIDIEIREGQFEKAIELANNILEKNENYLYAHVAIARSNNELRNFEEMYDAAQKIIELDSSCPEGYYYNALALFAQGDVNFAMESLKKAISLDVNNATLYIKMSEFYQDLRDFQMAYEWAKEASEIDEQSYKYKWLCAKLASSLRKEEEAVKYYSLSYRLASFDKELAKDYSDYLKSIGKEKQALSLLK